MCSYRDVIRETFGIDCDGIPGTGAAGGLGAALMVFLGGEMKSGIETVLDLIRFDEQLGQNGGSFRKLSQEKDVPTGKAVSEK